jgi:hypothetical protein
MVKAAEKNHTIDELSALFDDIDIENNLDTEGADYGTTQTSSQSRRSFGDRCEDVRLGMENEVSQQEDTQQSEPEPEPEPEFEPDAYDQMIQVDDKPEDKPEPEIEAEAEVCDMEYPEAVGSVVESAPEDNPLNLQGANLSAYNTLRDKYPHFKLSDKSQAFNDFYCYKVILLKSLFTSYPLLPLDDMRKEVENVSFKRPGSDDSIDPKIIKEKMSTCFMPRPRLATLLASAYAQLPVWKKCSSMLNAKLWKDHESKGAHKREALELEHNCDIALYVSKLQGFVDSAMMIDGVLKAENDSLSRQLSCVLTRHEAGVHDHDERNYGAEKVRQKKASSNQDSSLDELDVIEMGTVIPKSQRSGLVEKDFGGAEIDSEFLKDIG